MVLDRNLGRQIGQVVISGCGFTIFVDFSSNFGRFLILIRRAQNNESGRTYLPQKGVFEILQRGSRGGGGKKFHFAVALMFYGSSLYLPLPLYLCLRLFFSVLSLNRYIPSLSTYLYLCFCLSNFLIFIICLCLYFCLFFSLSLIFIIFLSFKITLNFYYIFYQLILI